MRNVLIAALAAIMLLVGCASDDVPEVPSPEVPSEVATGVIEPSEELSPEELPEESASDPEPSTTELKRSPRGNIIKAIGEEALLVLDSDEEVTFRLVVTSIDFDYECGSHADKPRNGGFVALSMDVETTDLWEADDFIQVTMHDFRAWDADGYRINDIVESTFSCDVKNWLPSDPFRPNDKARGELVFDLPDDAWISFEPFGDGGWEWHVQRS